ncbi:protein kinase domain-containing protein [Novosphingobium aquimarinum]|uniref:protein kinase domain-containing protein n=1 Tax=Novosphingobium aquimarinum TaxID=2682494 RepID=UPI0012ECA9C1|nr:protein kinase [Novosphingobium aquimarinum]
MIGSDHPKDPGETPASDAAPDEAGPDVSIPDINSGETDMSGAPSIPPPPEDSRAAMDDASLQPTVQPIAPSQGLGRQIAIGDVLNHIYEVTRFIARGGMGEVFEGVNVNHTDEKVAIKVILPQLAADPNVVALFRKEARTLTQLNHEALVAYRVLASDPTLGVLYIVTDYIDGDNLLDVLGDLTPSTDELLAFLKRIASGLKVAHERGAIHRDMSPDNVLLPDGELLKAKIIDFGIAKDLDPGQKTIIGQGFAGKLGYVAPEQLGSFNSNVGPWTDVYSLALVVLAVARGADVNMGGSLADAVVKRRDGPDLEGLDPKLRSILEEMLPADPADRLQSMDEVLERLQPRAAVIPDGLVEGAAVASPGLAQPSGVTSGNVITPMHAAKPKKNLGPIIFIVLIAIAVLAGLVWWLTSGSPDEPGEATGAGDLAISDDLPPAEKATRLVNSALPSVGCTWLSIVDVTDSPDAVKVNLTGVAGNPKQAKDDIARVLQSGGLGGAQLDFSEVAPITQAGCSALDTYRQVRDLNDDRLQVPARTFKMTKQPADDYNYPNKVAAYAPVSVDAGIGNQDLTLVGLEPSGVFTTIVGTKQVLADQLAAKNPMLTQDGPDKYRLNIGLDHEGWSGILLLTGEGPFDKDVVVPPVGQRGADWQNKFLAEAAEKGWRTEMVWFKSTA